MQGDESQGARKSQGQTSGSWDHTHPQGPKSIPKGVLQKGLSSLVGSWALSLDTCCSLHNCLGVLPSPDPFPATIPLPWDPGMPPWPHLSQAAVMNPVDQMHL